MRIVLIGNPNVGKSTLFNSLTGQKQKVANWPGKTIECKKGTCIITKEKIEIVDLPGTYSLCPFSDDESEVLDAISSDKYDVLVQVVDASNLQRNLYLTTELLEKTNKLIVALNMNEVAKKNGIELDIAQLENEFKIKFVQIDARKKSTLAPLIETAINLHKNKDKNKSVEEYTKTEDMDCKNNTQRRYERISKCMQRVSNCQKQKSFVHGWDSIFLHSIIGPIVFLLIMFLIFNATYAISDPITEVIESWLEIFSQNILELFKILNTPKWFTSLILDGIIAGVGGILVFIAPITVLTFFMYFLEDCGYLARVVVVFDSWLSRLGIGAKAFIPLVLGFGCNVPAILATKIIRDKKDRLITILISPFISCSARLAVYVLFVSVFFVEHEPIVLFSLYILGIIVALITAFMLKRLVFKQEDCDLLIEIPKLQIPYFQNLYCEIRMTLIHFFGRATSVILAGSLIIWLLASLPYGVEYGSKESFAGIIGQTIAPIFEPLGFGEWQPSLAILNGIMAKEIVISSLATSYSAQPYELESVISNQFSSASALSFMVFVLLYIPCIAVVGATLTQTKNSRITLLSILYTFAVAWILSFATYNLALFFGI